MILLIWRARLPKGGSVAKVNGMRAPVQGLVYHRRLGGKEPSSKVTVSIDGRPGALRGRKATRYTFSDRTSQETAYASMGTAQTAVGRVRHVLCNRAAGAAGGADAIRKEWRNRAGAASGPGTQ